MPEVLSETPVSGPFSVRSPVASEASSVFAPYTPESASVPPVRTTVPIEGKEPPRTIEPVPARWSVLALVQLETSMTSLPARASSVPRFWSEPAPEMKIVSPATFAPIRPLLMSEDPASTWMREEVEGVSEDDTSEMPGSMVRVTLLRRVSARLSPEYP